VGGNEHDPVRPGESNCVHLGRALPDVCRRPRVGRAWPDVYATSTEQMGGWLAELDVGPAPVRPLAIPDVVRGAVVAGPVPGLAEQVRDLHRRFRSG
jgi:hypothetical protein